MRRSLLLALGLLTWSSAAEPTAPAATLAAARAADPAWQTVVERLRHDLTSTTTQTQLDAVHLTVALGDPSLTDALVPLLEPGVDPRLIEATCLAMADLHDVDAAPRILPHLHDAEVQVRQAAFLALTRLGALTAKECQALLHDQDTVIRTGALFHVALAPTPETVAAIADGAEHAAEPSLRRLCALALGRTGDAKHANVLRRVLLDRDARVRGAAAQALVALHDRASLPDLLLAVEQGAWDRDLIDAIGRLSGRDFGLASASDRPARQRAVANGWTWWGANAGRP